MKNITLIVKLIDSNPLVYTFSTPEEAKVADRYIQKEWEEFYVSSKIIYGN